ncbi:NADH:ubiquinone oxidoreductase subunit F (NADH-binding) [Nakamurella sp. UYEF19]|uniref:NADH-ubiquinone oxidoreductase-F iron-sulfur binding region domain-containing protein n=1 Tax=Nakamurella sp. UYEF19 TaxID=1756392 RepID=UPI0033985AFB
MTEITRGRALLGSDFIDIGSSSQVVHKLDTRVPRQDRTAHEAAFGVVTAGLEPNWLDQQVRAIALTGRGGAHFPVATKWRAAQQADVGGWTLVVNASEGEPASGKDAALLQLRPHLVLDGAELAASMIGADRVVIWLADEARATLQSLRSALAERRSGLTRAPEIVTTPERYLAGESSAVIRAVHGGPPLPRTTMNPAQPWAGGPPVLVHNVETLARLGLLARTGSRSFEPSSLVTVTDGDRRFVAEVPAGETFSELFERAKVPVPQAVLLGGYGGEWVGWSELALLAVDPHALKEAGRSLGAGVLIALGRFDCGLEMTASIAHWLADQSAGQCGPCRFGLPEVVELVSRLAGRRAGQRDLDRLHEKMALVDGRGACRLPDGALRMIRSALREFAAEINDHRYGRCLQQEQGR